MGAGKEDKQEDNGLLNGSDDIGSFFLCIRRFSMQTEVMEDRAGSKEIICRFYANLVHPQEGYYRMETADGEFLGNVDEGELKYELSVLEEHGYRKGHIIGCRGC